jgi:hypothetical protein
MAVPGESNLGLLGKLGVEPTVSGVSIPDQRRIDSDVRAFLRQPSTPWIVFDRDSRPPQVSVGDVFLVPRRSLLSLSDAHFFTSAPELEARGSACAAGSFVARGLPPLPAEPPLSPVEPSTLTVATDLLPVGDPVPDLAEDIGPAPMFNVRPYLLSACGAVLSFGLVVAVAAFAIGRSGTVHEASASPALVSPAAAGQQVRSAATPVTSQSVAGAPAEGTLEAPSDSNVVVPTPLASAGTASSPKKYVRFAIAGEARTRDVYLDGKRLLGHGARSFPVLCGTHTVAVGRRSDTRAVEIPCTSGAELVLTK